jgi:hypothetical protein
MWSSFTRRSVYDTIVPGEVFVNAGYLIGCDAAPGRACWSGQYSPRRFSL